MWGCGLSVPMCVHRWAFDDGSTPLEGQQGQRECSGEGWLVLVSLQRVCGWRGGEQGGGMMMDEM